MSTSSFSIMIKLCSSLTKSHDSVNSEKQIVARLVSDAKSLESPVGRAIAVESAFPSL